MTTFRLFLGLALFGIGCGDESPALDVTITIVTPAVMTVEIGDRPLRPTDDPPLRSFQVHDTYPDGLGRAVVTAPLQVAFFEDSSLVATETVPRVKCHERCLSEDCSDLGVLVEEHALYFLRKDVEGYSFTAGETLCLGTQGQIASTAHIRE